MSQGSLKVICFEQILRIRVIQLNGTVKKINLDLKLDPVNYCLFDDVSGVKRLYLIKIYPLQKLFILINYIRTTNSSNLSTYKDWGDVIDLNGNNLSSTLFGPSYIDPTGHWVQSSIFQSINKKLGFLRLDAVNQGNLQWTRWQQYLVNDFGKLSPLNMTSGNIQTNRNETSSIIKVLLTVDSGYALVHDRLFTLYELNSQNTSFGSLYCDVASVGVGHICTISVRYPNTTNNTVFDTEYVKINFLSSGAVLSSSILSDLPKLTGVSDYGWRVKTMPFGGYILDSISLASQQIAYYTYAYYENNTQVISGPHDPFITNGFVAKALLHDNTFLLASPYTNDMNTSWSLFTIPLIKILADRDHGYGNILIDQIIPYINANVDSYTTVLNITFYDPVVLSIGSLSIYKASDNSIRQKVSATMDEFCKVDPDGKTISIIVIGSTFNEFGESYYVTMDNNFVKSKDYNEPLEEIVEEVLKYNSSNNLALSDFYFIDILTEVLYYLVTKALPLEENAICSARLTTEATKNVSTLSKNDQKIYFNSLLNEISSKLPVRRERLKIFRDP
ncbi:hypothetical protein F8M41_007001 [Gigaspora margarita]|uniref:Uncharacterized protein n=1 Tax=Gigaspora margarita TaxID=4874 RepID=A0A8H3X5M5_GIGMA|nr:hypothetical protein F8M41_007001 [Gigaspora margarita]